MSITPTMRWLDLSAHGARLAIFQIDGSTTHLMLSGIPDRSAEWDAVQQLGFSPTESRRHLVRLGTDINTRALRSIFPRARVADMEVSKVWLKVRAPSNSPHSYGDGEEQRQEGKGPRPLGINLDGNPVFEDETGRFYRSQGVAVYEDKTFLIAAATDVEGAKRSAMHLRATNTAALQLCADAFVREMANGQSMRKFDLARFAQVVNGEASPLTSGDTRLRQAQEAVEAGMQRALSNAANRPDDEAFSLAVALTDRQPTFSYRTSTSVGNQQYSTPLPMSVVAQRILAVSGDAEVLEPTIGNGSLVALLPPGARITGVEIDPDRAEQTRYGAQQAAAARGGEPDDLRVVARRAAVNYIRWLQDERGYKRPDQIASGVHGGRTFQVGGGLVKRGMISVDGWGSENLFKLAELWKEAHEMDMEPPTDAGRRQALHAAGLQIFGERVGKLSVKLPGYEYANLHLVREGANLWRVDGRGIDGPGAISFGAAVRWAVKTLRIQAVRDGVDIEQRADMASGPFTQPRLTVVEGDFVGIGKTIGSDFDYVIANPPFGGLTQPVVVENLRVTRIDHLIALKALQRRKEDGRAVFIVGADRESLHHPGKVAGGSKTFLAWLTDHYEIEDAVELNGALYKKQGAEYPVRMLTVGRRRTEREAAIALETKEYRLSDPLPVIHTWEALWAHASRVTNAYARRKTGPDSAQVLLDVETASVEQAVLPLPGTSSLEQADAVLAGKGGGVDAINESGHSGDGDVAGIETRHEENEYQAPYIPASHINEPTAMIPRNLEGPVRKALARLTEEIGEGVDSYVAHKLDFTYEDLEVAFSAEQVDAIALAIKRIEEGRGFIVGDQTGQGKGRILAGIARYAVLSGMSVTFFTEKANLFSDFWRDLKDIGSDDLFTPFVLNTDEPVRNMETNKVEINASKPAELKRIMDGRMSIQDAGHNLMFTTYSQFNRDQASSKKAAWLPDAVKNSVVILDESHVAAGESNTGDNIARAVEHSSAAIYSSATYAKNAKNMRAYSKVFPPSVQVESLADTLLVGGEPLQEVLSAMLAEEGVFIRREHDLSKLEFQTIVASRNAELYESWADSLSAALREMAYLSGDVSRVAKTMNKQIRKELEKLPEDARKGNRMGVSYQGFGSRLYNILRQFMIAIKIDDAADTAVQALKEGRKPVLVMEQTFEALLKEVLQSRDELDVEIDNVNVSGTSIPRPTFRDVMHRVAQKLEYIYVRDDYGNGHYENIRDQAKTDDEREAIEGVILSVKDKIDRLPDLAVAPLDTIREKIEAHGFKVGEISGRTFESRQDPTDKDRIVVTVRPDERLRTIQEFNNGTIDAAELTRAGATGLSLHASEKFADQRQREMIEVQIANNVAERVQFFGRVNRRGQVNDPRITTIVSPLPSEARALAMQNTKLRKLSANTQSNRNNQAELRDVPDILNKIGDDICRRYLMENPDIAALLDIDAEEETESTDDAYFANKLTGRIALLPVAKQRAVYADLARVYTETLAELEAKGINPFQTSVYDWGAKVVETKVFRAGKERGSVFDRPTYLATLEWEEEVIPISGDVMRAAVERARKVLVEGDGRFELRENRYATSDADKWQLLASKMVADIDGAFDRVQKRSMRTLDSFKTIEEAMTAPNGNPIKFSQARRVWLKEKLPYLVPGKLVSFSGDEDARAEGMVMSLHVPEDADDAHLLGQYQVSIVVPGSATPSKVTFNQLIGDAAFGPVYSLGSDYRNPYGAFDTAKPGRVLFRRHALTGNMFAAAQFAAQHRCGNAGIFVDEKGDRHRAVIMYARITADDLENQPVALSRTQANELLERAASEGAGVVVVGDSSLDADKAVQIILHANKPDAFMVVAPGAKATGGRIFTSKVLTDITGDFAGDRRRMSVTVPISKLDAVIGVLTGTCGQALYVAAGKARQLMPQLDGIPAADRDDLTRASRPRLVA